MDNMKQLMIELFNMSLSASFVVLAVLVLRAILKSAPKIYSYVLWIFVFIRFLCPVTIKSALSLIPVKNKTLSYSTSAYWHLSLNTGFKRFDHAVTYRINDYGKLYAPTEHSTADILITVLYILWLAGILALLIWFVASYIRLKQKLKTATLIKVNNSCPVYETDRFQIPFLLGIIRPKIYIPIGLEKEELKYVLAHELMHIKRKDYLVKPLCFLAVLLHWFNPLAWLSIHMMIKDMELSCDEAVLRKTGEDIRIQYSNALLNVSMKQSGLFLPIAFGESNTKSRIKNVLKFKKPAIWIGTIGVIILGATAITLLTSNAFADRESDMSDSARTNSITNNSNSAEKTMDELLVINRNLYIGNHAKDGTLIGTLPVPEGLSYDHIELQTKNEPYELTVYYSLKDSTSWKTTETEVSNAILLFSTIQNMGICHFKILEESSLDVTFYRDELEKTFDKLYPRSSSTDGMKELKRMIKEYLSSFRLEESITKAILDENMKKSLRGEFQTESHVVLDTKEDKDSITVYAMVLYQEYGFEDGKFKDISGSHMPIAITFQIEKDGEYKLKEYWKPKDGSYYVPSIKNKFPASIVDKALDTQKYIKQQQKECDQKAEEYMKTLKNE